MPFTQLIGLIRDVGGVLPGAGVQQLLEFGVDGGAAAGFATWTGPAAAPGVFELSMQPARASGAAVAAANRASVFRNRGAVLGRGMLGMGDFLGSVGRNSAVLGSGSRGCGTAWASLGNIADASPT